VTAIEERTNPAAFPEIAVFSDPNRSWDKKREECSNPLEVALCQQIESEIQALCQPYRNLNTPWTDFWSVTPGYSQLPMERLEAITRQVATLTKVYDFTNDYFGSPLAERFGTNIDTSVPAYFRLDALSSTQPLNSVINAEVGTVPVGEGEVTAMRRVYQELLGGDVSSFLPGSAQTLAKLFRESFGQNEPIRIVLPPRRLGYLGDYQFVSQYCQEQGLDVQVEDPKDLHLEDNQLVGKYGTARVIYRGFQLSDLEGENDFAEADLLLDCIGKERVTLFPQITYWDRKDLLGLLFQPEIREALATGVGPETANSFYRMFPWTWVCDRSKPPMLNGEFKPWSYFKEVTTQKGNNQRKPGFILKPINGREARGLVFRWQVSSNQWSHALDDALCLDHGQPGYIIQQDADDSLERFVGTYWDRENNVMVRNGGYRDRLCVNTFVSGRSDDGARQVIIGDIDHTLRRNTRLIHTASDAIHVPTYVI